MGINREQAVQPLDTSTLKAGSLNGKKVLATGTLLHFSRKGIEETVKSLGGSYASSVSASLDFLVAGDNAGSKLQKAKDLGIKVLSENEFVSMITK
jgi:DNA ligase (NAD+)